MIDTLRLTAEEARGLLERREVTGSPSTQAHLAAALGTSRAELFA